jgi:hypothetical protein
MDMEAAVEALILSGSLQMIGKFFRPSNKSQASISLNPMSRTAAIFNFLSTTTTVRTSTPPVVACTALQVAIASLPTMVMAMVIVISDSSSTLPSIRKLEANKPEFNILD